MRSGSGRKRGKRQRTLGSLAEEYVFRADHRVINAVMVFSAQACNFECHLLPITDAVNQFGERQQSRWRAAFALLIATSYIPFEHALVGRRHVARDQWRRREAPWRNANNTQTR